MATITLDRMARGGIYDQLGGGFHRYSVDQHWLVPHFEKMLYDNALLVRCYLEAFQVTSNKMYASVARETLEYVLREMSDPEGGFYAAQDAGEVGREGEYFVWHEQELSDVLSEPELEAIKKLYGVTAAGNFENEFNILNLQDGMEWSDKAEPAARAARERLLSLRAERKPPHLDDKVLTSWNALMISAFCKGWQVLGEERFLTAAQQSAQFIRSTLYSQGTLLRRYRDGESKFDAYLDDYSFLIQALIDLYESDFEPKWLHWAEALQSELDAGFWDEKNSGYFYTTEQDPSVLIRKKEITDGAIPSGNAVAAFSLLRLFHLTYREEYRQRGQKVLEALSGFLVQFPSALCYSLSALEFDRAPVKELALVGDVSSEFGRGALQKLRTALLPNKVIAAGAAGADYPALLRGKDSGSEAAVCYLCRDKTCLPPVADLAALEELLEASA